MAGLDPAIQPFRLALAYGLDPRVKPGDEGKWQYEQILRMRFL